MNNLNFHFFVLFSFIILSSNCQTYICNSSKDKLKVGDKAYLCIHILESNTKIIYPLEVDEYSVVTIKGIYSQISSNKTNINFLAQVQDMTSIFPSVSYFNQLIICNIYL